MATTPTMRGVGAGVGTAFGGPVGGAVGAAATPAVVNGAIAAGNAVGNAATQAGRGIAKGASWLGDAMGFTNTKTPGLDAEQERARQLYAQYMQTQAGSYVPDPIQAPSIGMPADVGAQDVTAQGIAPASVVAPDAVTAPTMAPVREVSTGDVAVPTLDPAAVATYERVNGARINSADDSLRDEQGGYIKGLKDAVAGVGPSAADPKFQQALAEINANAYGAAASARGNEEAFARRMAGRDVADQTRRAALDAATLKAQEQITARGQLGAAIEAGRGQDINLASTNATLAQGANLANQATGAQTSQFNVGQRNTMGMEGARLTADILQNNAARSLAAQTTNANAGNAQALEAARLQTGVAEGNAARALAAGTTNAELAQGAAQFTAGAQNTAATGNADRAAQVGTANANRGVQVATTNAGNALEAAKANQNATLQGQQLGVQERQGLRESTLAAGRQSLDAAQAKTNVATGDKDRKQKAISGTIGGIASTAASLISDERAKEGLRPESDRAQDEFLDGLKAVTYRYKDGIDGAEPGQQHGLTAQQLEKSDMGRDMVRERPDGLKAVDTDELTMALAGIVADMHRELKSLKRKAA